MKPQEYVAYDATGLAELVAQGQVDPSELVEASIERIEALNDRLNAVVERSFDAARAAAREVSPRAPLPGVPFLAKDVNIEVAGLKLTASCRWLASLPPAAVDAPLAERWRSAGLAILGRTNTPEWAGDFVTEPTWRGATLNPWDPTRTPGGSSGGAAAAVSSGMVPVAHGTDSGGSIRVPAAVCGLVGLKPSRGWVPVGPNHDELAGGLDCEHVLTRSVRDTALLLDLTCGPEPTRRYPWLPPGQPFVRSLGGALEPLRIGIALKSPGGRAPEQEVGAAVEAVAAVLAKAGHTFSAFGYPREANMGDATTVIWMTAIAEEIDHYRTHIRRSPAPSELEALSRESVAAAQRWTATDYVRARRTLTATTRSLAQAFREIDVLLLPTTATLPPLIGEIDSRTAAFDIEHWTEAAYRFAPYSELFNVTGQPAISLPLGESRTGLPIGVQLVAPLGQDARLLALAAWLEREQPWDGRGLRLRRRLANERDARRLSPVRDEM
jgi:amidase